MEIDPKRETTAQEHATPTSSSNRSSSRSRSRSSTKQRKKDDNNTRPRRNDHNRDNGRPRRGEEKRRERGGEEERGQRKGRSDENHVHQKHKRRSIGKKLLSHRKIQKLLRFPVKMIVKRFFFVFFVSNSPYFRSELRNTQYVL